MLSDGSKTCLAYEQSRHLLVRSVQGLAVGADCYSALYNGAGVYPATMTSIQWHPTFRLPTEIAGPKQLQTMAYDSAGRLTSKATYPTTDNLGFQGFTAQVGSASVEGFGYNANGQLTAYDGPRTDVNDGVAYGYGAAGVLVSMTNGLGQVTSYSQHDGSGRPGLIVLPSGTQLVLGYDPKGRLTTSLLGGETTSYSYFANDKLASTTYPDGESVFLTYDISGRVAKIADQRGSSKNLSYNLGGGAISEQTKTSTGALVLSTARVFDALNRVTQISGAHLVNTQPAPYTP